MEMKKPVMCLLCAAVILTGIAAVAHADPNGAGGSWTGAGNMLHARQNHASTLLQNGKVLITGWDTREAELYDPASGTFAPAGQMANVRRDGLTATLLNDGKVLIAGGTGAQKTAEIYDPATGLFSPAVEMKTVHSHHSATLLADGRVLIAAGQDNSGPQTHAVAEIYDPGSGTFNITGSLAGHRSGHTAALLPDGKVLITAGIQTTTPGFGIYIDTNELFDPAAGVFSQIAPLGSPRTGHSATLISGGRVLISGGAWYQNACELYDGAAGTWSRTGPMTVARRNYHTATLLGDGTVLLAGGFVGSATRGAERYDPTTNAFTAADSMLSVRMSHGAVRLADGRVLITGGYDGSLTTSSAEIFTSDTATSVRVANSHTGGMAFALSQNYPNPFNPETRIRFTLSAGGRVSLKIFDLSGREVGAVADGIYPSGTCTVQFDGSRLAAGIYFYRLTAAGFTETRKMVLSR